VLAFDAVMFRRVSYSTIKFKIAGTLKNNAVIEFKSKTWFCSLLAMWGQANFSNIKAVSPFLLLQVWIASFLLNEVDSLNN